MLAFDLLFILSYPASLLLLEFVFLQINRCKAFRPNIVFMSSKVYHCADTLIRLLYKGGVFLFLVLLRLYHLLELLLRLLLIKLLLLRSLLLRIPLLINIGLQPFEYISAPCSLRRLLLPLLLALYGSLTILKFFFSDQSLQVNGHLRGLTFL